MYGYICDNCGARLDPGEKCDCGIKKARSENERVGEKTYIHYSREDNKMQADFDGREKNAVGGT